MSNKIVFIVSFCSFEQKLDKIKKIFYTVISDNLIIMCERDEKMVVIYRKQYVDKLISFKDKKIIKVLTDIRRSGKSTILEEFKNYLLENGVSEKNIIFINLDDKSNKDLLSSDFLHDYILKHVSLKEKNYIFLDEIQNVFEFEKCINSLFLRENLDIYITGSNSYMLSSELATFLASPNLPAS